MTGPKADTAPLALGFTIVPGLGLPHSPLSQACGGWVAGVMGEGDTVLRPWEGEDWQLGGWAGSLNPVSWHQA